MATKKPIELDIKQNVLVAIYTEYQRDVPDMFNNITAKSLKLDERVFSETIDKLQNEGYINGANFFESVLGFDSKTHKVIPPARHLRLYANMKITRDGIKYVEKLLGIDETANKKDILTRIKDSPITGIATDFISKTAAEIIKKLMGL